MNAFAASSNSGRVSVEEENMKAKWRENTALQLEE